jgi:hypothetical protein
MPSRRELVDMLAALVRAAKNGGVHPGGSLLNRASEMISRERRGDVRPIAWRPLERANLVQLTPERIADIVAVAERFGGSADDVRHLLAEADSAELWINHTYQVMLRRFPETGAAYLSIKRIDQAQARSWRDIQQIKDQLLGPDCEAVELFPAQGRLVDTANQYHLWGSTDPAFRFPFGFTHRAVSDDIGMGEGQAPLETAPAPA